MSKQPFLLFAVLIAGLAVLWSVVPPPTGIGPVPVDTQAQAVPASDTLNGYAWSSNIGWIKFKGSDYKVEVNGSDELNGYAWSSNIGWIKFGGLSGCPGGVNCAARLSGDKLVGWARACAAAADPRTCSGGTHPDSVGWDGWISLSGTATDAGHSPYGVEKIDHPNGSASLRGFAWGGEVVGWVDFSPGIDGNTCNPVVEVCWPDDNSLLSVVCSANNNDGSVTLDPNTQQAEVIWKAEVLFGTYPNYDYVWSGDVTGSNLNTPDREYIIPKTYDINDVGLKEAKITVTDDNQTVQESLCSINVLSGAPPVGGAGTLEVQGDGLIEIRHQASGMPAATIDGQDDLFAEIKNVPPQNGQGGTITNIRVKSIESQKNNGLDLAGAIDAEPACLLSNTQGGIFRPCNEISESLASGGTLYFRLQVPRPLKAIADNNPYEIVFEGDTVDPVTGNPSTTEAKIIFTYLVGSFDPI